MVAPQSPGDSSAEELGAKTGHIPVFTEYVPGSDAARSEKLPDHFTNEPRVRDEGDAWAIGPDGTRMWGRFGAAGLLAFDRGRGVLMQHRALWSHFGGTWGIPGGALNKGEEALDAAVREAHEEALVPPDALDPLFARVVDLGFWSYTTFVAETMRPFEAQITDDESAGLAWVAPHELARLRLHPGFAKSWPVIEPMLHFRPLIVVANLGGAAGLIDAVSSIASNGIAADIFGMDATRVWPSLTCVVEAPDFAAVRGHGELPQRVEVVPADGSSDDLVVEIVRSARETNAHTPIVVVTADPQLRSRVGQYGAESLGAQPFFELASD